MFKQQQEKPSFAQQLKKKFAFHLGGDGSKSPSQDDISKHASNPVPSNLYEQGKKLPRVPTSDEEKIMSSILKGKTSLSSNMHIKCYSQFFLEYSVASEYNYLKKQRLPGVYVIPSFSNPLVWFGVIFIRQGIYQDGVFRFIMRIPPNYPDADCPSVTFTPAIFHPCVNPSSGDLDLKPAFSPWRPNQHHIWQICLYMRRIFYKPDVKDASNPLAKELYVNDIDAFKRRARESVDEVSSRLYEDCKSLDDQHLIRFRPWDPLVHEPIRDKLFGRVEGSCENLDENSNSGFVASFDQPKLSGLSFMEPGTTLIFSRDS